MRRCSSRRLLHAFRFPGPRGGMKVNWYTEDDDRLIAEMLADGASRREIAARLGRSRNSICGRISRLARPNAMPIRTYGAAEKTTPKAAHPSAPKPAPASASSKPSSSGVQPDQTESAALTAHHDLSVPHVPMPAATISRPWSKPIQPLTCAFPIDQPGRPKFRFCGAPAEIGRPYCSAHCQIAYLRA